MRAEIELYKGSRRAYYGSLSITMLLTDALRERLKEAEFSSDTLATTRRTRVVLYFNDPDELSKLSMPRPVAELGDSLGWLLVRFLEDGRLVYEGRYGIGELMGTALARTLFRIDPDEPKWAFAFRNLSTAADVRPAPDVEGAVDVDMRQDSRPLPFTIQQVETPVPEDVDSAELGIDPSLLGPVNVLVTRDVHALMVRRLPFSERVEEGGFLLGRIQSVSGDASQQLTRVTHVTPAAQAGASAIHFTFTPDSFKEVNRLLAERDRGEELVGWYHTHLFAATADIGTATGLSSIDIDTHFATFQRSGQVAGLINLSGRRRVLRFYSRVEDKMEECRVWIGDERGRYRAASTDLDHR
jgi:proteasome lid subunit RPN8/RPN11